jgi:Cu/Ag efflux pump CusA
VTQASKEMRQVPGVRNFGSHIGQATLGDEVVGVNLAENWISIDPKADYDKTVQKVQEIVGGYPGLQRDMETYLTERVNEVLAGGSEAIIVRIFGNDLHVLQAKAKEVNRILDDIHGVVEAHVELSTDVPQIDVQVDLDKAKQYGLVPGDVRRQAATLVSGEEVGDLYRGGRAYDAQVWSAPSLRHSLSDIQDLLISAPDGRLVRLGSIAKVAIKPTPNAIKRENASRRIDVGANVKGRDIGSVVRELEKGLAKVQFPREYHAQILGEFAERQAAQHRLFLFSIVAMLGVLLILRGAFKGWRLAIISFLTLPSALVGGILAAWLGSGVLSLGSLVGFLTVFGIAARNKIMLLNHYEHLELYEGMQFGPALVIRGAVERLSPIMMTALATGLAVVPLVVAGSLPGHEIEHPMALVILGGLVTSTLLNLFIVPSLYLRFGKSFFRKKTALAE